MDGDPPVAHDDEPDNEDFGTSGDVGDGYPEEEQPGAAPEGSDPKHRFKQEGTDRPEG